jgi:hypothetical protein
MIPTLIGVAVLVFFMLRVVPGDVVEVKLRGDGGTVSQETIDMERRRLGLDKPLVYQFGDWMIGLAKLDLGKSMWTERPVIDEIAIRLELSLEVAILASIFAVLISIPLGTAAARHLDRLRRPHRDHRRAFDTIVLVRHAHHFDVAVFFQLAAAHHLHADLRRPGRQSDPADMAGDGGRLSLLRGDRAHDPLVALGSAERRLHPHRARQRRGRKARRFAPCAA